MQLFAPARPTGLIADAGRPFARVSSAWIAILAFFPALGPALATDELVCGVEELRPSTAIIVA